MGTVYKKSEVIGEMPACSICKNEDIYFFVEDSEMEKVQALGKIFLVRNLETKYYCKECFEEYGGELGDYE